MADANENGPLGEGETVYATEPTEGTSEDERDWPDHTDPEWLHYQYNVLEKSMSELADEVDLTHGAIQHQMEKRGIDRRELSDGQRMYSDPKMWDGEWLKEKYIGEELSLADIAELRGVGKATVRMALDRAGIERRSYSEANVIDNRKRHSERPYRNQEWLVNQYWGRLKSKREIADEIGCGRTTIQTWLENYKIPKRSKSEGELVRHSECDSFLDRGENEWGVVVRGSDGDVVLKKSWQYSHERPEENSDE